MSATLTLVARCIGIFSVMVAVLGCTSDNFWKLDAGVIAFSTSEAEACLAAMADGGCDPTSQQALAAACAAMLVANTLPGGVCDANSDCIPIDAGPVQYNEQVGTVCTIPQDDSSDPFNLGACTFGYLAGQPRRWRWQHGHCTRIGRGSMSPPGADRSPTPG